MARPADPFARTALMTAARAAFVKHGILRARIEDITAACGLSKGAFYLHFESKEALFGELAAELEAAFDRIRRDRSRAYQTLLEPNGGARGSAAFFARLNALAEREDERMLELLWTWRDVIDVLLRGCQGTDFDGVMWELVDQQLALVRTEFRRLQAAGLARDDVAPDMLGMIVVGTYLFVVRRLVLSKEKPDFGELVRGLSQVLGGGIAPARGRVKANHSTGRVAKSAPNAGAPRVAKKKRSSV